MAEVGSYIYIAQRDLNDAMVMFDAKSFTSSGRFSEQAIEKALKHFIHLKGSSRDYRLLTLHKPMRLYTKCQEYLLNLELTKEEIFTLGILDDYYYDTNYPGNAFFELDEEDAKLALELANKIVKFILEQDMRR